MKPEPVNTDDLMASCLTIQQGLLQQRVKHSAELEAEQNRHQEAEAKLLLNQPKMEQYKARVRKAESELKAQKALFEKTNKDVVATHEAQVKELQTELKNSQEENDQIKQRFSTFFNTTFNGSSDLTRNVAQDPSRLTVASGTANTRADKKKRKFRRSKWTDAEMMTLYHLRCAIGSNDWKALEQTQKLTTRNHIQMRSKWIQHVSFKTECSPLETCFRMQTQRSLGKRRRACSLESLRIVTRMTKPKKSFGRLPTATRRPSTWDETSSLQHLDFFR